ncbi:MAG: MopE-related protein [Bacteroidota bacterium]
MRNLKTYLLFSLALLGHWTTSFAQAPLTFSASQTTTNCGDQVCVDVTATDFTDVLSFQYSINWQSNVLGVASVQSFGIDNMEASQFNATIPGILRVGYDDSNLTGVTLPDNSVLFQVCFDVAPNRTGNSTIDFSGNPTPIEVVDVQGNILETAFQSGSVTINCGDDDEDMDNEMPIDSTGMDDMTDNGMDNDTTDNTMISDDLGFVIGQLTASCDEQICLDVTANGFANISSFQYSLNWDPNLLGAATVQSFGLPDMDASQFNATTAGILRVGYDDSSLQGRSVADGTVLYQLCFDLPETADGTSAISFSDTPITTEVVDVAGSILTPTLQNGEVTVNCIDVIIPIDSMTMDTFTMEPIDTMTAIDNELPLGFVIDSAIVNCGNQVCLDVRVQGFTDVTFFRYSVNWDFMVLGTQEVQQTNLENLRFGTIGPGSFWTEWRSPNGQGVTIADNEVIYTVCFNTPDEGERATEVAFSNIPIPIQVNGLNSQLLRPNLQNGAVEVTCVPEVEDAPDSLIFAINNAVGNCGEQTCLSVTAQDFNDILSFQYSINYNEVLGAATLQNFGLAGMTANNLNTSTAGIVRVGWDDANLLGVSVPDETVLFDICFNAAADLSGAFEVDFSATPIAIEVADVDGNIVTPRLLGGAVNIICDAMPPVDTTDMSVDTMVADKVEFGISDASVSCGERVCVDVTAKNFNDILSFQYSINYDAAQLGNPSVEQFNLVGLGIGNFNLATDGIIRVGWTDLNVAGVTMVEDAVLYQICFDAIGNETTNTAVEFSDNPLPSEIMNSDNEIIVADFNNGNVAITCVVIEPPVDTMPTIGDELTFELSKTSGDCADQVCVDVKVYNFSDILSYQYSVNWDAPLLGQATVEGFNMPDLGAANFNTNTAGVLRVGWDDSFITGVSLVDGQTIYQICFDNVDQTVDNLPITFSGNPTSIEVVNAQSSLVAPTFINGSLTVDCDSTGTGNPDPDPEPTGELTFTAADAAATCGEQMCTDITVKGFNDVLSFQYSITWEATILGQATVQGFGIPDLNASNFNNNTAGILRVGWDDSFITGVTLPDDHVIFQVCFAPVSESIENTAISFSGTPTSIEVVDRDGQLLNPSFQNGSISTDCTPMVPVDNDGDGFAEDVDCDDNNPIVFPGATEFPNNNVDEDCDGVALFIDADNDGFNSSIDCDDNNPNINGRAEEIPNNGIDEDCDGQDLVTNTLVDEDGDGFTNDVDCDDNNPIVFPGATEFPNNDVDEDCDGVALFIDADNDGFNSSIDCDDNNPNINGRAEEIPNNGIDEDCDGQDLVTNTTVDADGDGFTNDVDCNDNNPNINPDATEVPNNGIDEDCSGDDLVVAIDADNDGFAENVDCDDTNPNINPDATEIPNNGIDEDCSGDDLMVAIDADNDGFAEDVDCDDNNPDINPDATEIPNNGIDEDCSGDDLVEMIDSTAVAFNFTPTTTTCGSQVCLDAKVRNFDDLISFQYSLSWDSTKLANVTTQNYNLEGLNASAFFTPKSGVMRVSWFDTRVVGVSIPNDETVFQICFDVISTTVGTTTVKFTNTPIPIEVVDNTSSEANVAMTDGVITITNCSGALIGDSSTPTIFQDETIPTASIASAGFKAGSTDEQLIDLQLYPNPTSNLLTIALEQPLAQDGTVRIYDIWGQLLQTNTLAKDQIRLDLSMGAYAKGVYLVEVSAGDAVIRRRVLRQ